MMREIVRLMKREAFRRVRYVEDVAKKIDAPRKVSMRLFTK